MTKINFFDELPSAPEEDQKFIKDLIEERNRIFEKDLRNHPFYGRLMDDMTIVVNLPEPTPEERIMGLFHETLYQADVHAFDLAEDARVSKMLEDMDGYKMSMHIINHRKVGEFPYAFDYTAVEPLNPDEGKPEWQKRRDQSARAKNALIAKLKGKGK